MPQKWSDAKRADVFAKTKAGLSYREAGQIYGVSRSAIASVVHRVRHGPAPRCARVDPFFTGNLVVRVDEGMMADIDATRRPGESRASAVRSLIEWGLEACDTCP